MTEWAGLEIRKAACPLRGFESLSLRFKYSGSTAREHCRKKYKYRNSNELRYFCFIVLYLFRVVTEIAETPKILSNGYNLATLFSRKK